MESGSEVSGSGGQESLNLNNAAVMSLTLVPATFFAAIIAIVSLRWSLVVPCIVVAYFWWLTVTQRWLAEAMGKDAQNMNSRAKQLGMIPDNMLES